MLFEITNKNGDIWRYDNISNEIRSINGKKLLVDESCDKVKPLISKYKSIYSLSSFESLNKERLIKKLRIQLGLNCNCQCSFCLQKEFAKETPFPKLSEISVLFDKIDKSGIVIDQKANIQFWGGEPLIYWKSLKHLICIARDKYPLADLSMITNGWLLTKDIIDYLVEKRVRITISHDAQAYFLRGKDPLDDESIKNVWLYALEKYKANKLGFGINLVISQYNSDLSKIRRFFDDKFSKDVTFGIEGIAVAYTSDTVQFTSLSKESKIKLRESILNEVLFNEESSVMEALSVKVLNILRMLVYKIPTTDRQARCDAIRKDTLAIDVFGNILACHNVSAKQQSCGNISDYSNAKYKYFTHWIHREKCRDCLALVSCKGRCPRDTKQDERISCDPQFSYYLDLFECAWILLTGSEIESYKRLD